MRILCIGYYGQGNFGDELFKATFRQLLHPHGVKLDFVYPEKNMKVRKGDYDAVIIGGGDLINPALFSWWYWEHDIEVPVYIVSVGAALCCWSKRDEVMERYKKCIDSFDVRLVYVRDVRTAALLAEYDVYDVGGIMIAPDVTLLYEPEIKYEREEGSVLLCVRAREDWEVECGIGGYVARQYRDILEAFVEAGYDVSKMAFLIAGWGYEGCRDSFFLKHLMELYEGLGELGRQMKVERCLGIPAMIKRIAMSDVVISEKLHVFTEAWKYGCKAIAVSGCSKFYGFADMVGYIEGVIARERLPELIKEGRLPIAKPDEAIWDEMKCVKEVLVNAIVQG